MKNNNLLSFIPLTFYCLLFTAFCILFTTSVRAEVLTSPSFKIRFGNFNMTAGEKSSSSYALTDTVGQTAAGLFSSSGYAVKAGFQYMYTLYDFSFAISDLTIIFGSVTPNNFSTATNTLTVSAPGQGYSVSTIASNRLKKSGTSDYVPDTACDLGTCTESAAGVWTNTAVNGFGYNASGNDIAADFTGPTYFRPFPDLSLGDSPATVMTSTSAGRNRTATITYKLNVSGSQAAGDYENQITYIATPVY